MKSPEARGGLETRWWILIVLTGINLLNYIDRQIFSALLPAIKSDLGFSDTQLGILGSAFIFAYVLAAPLFGWLGDRFTRTHLLTGSVILWSMATASFGFMRSFGGMLGARAAVGAGESAYTVIAPTLLSDFFARGSRGRIFAVFSGAIPIGSALGYVLGGLLEEPLGWERAFFVVGVPGVFLALFIFLFRDPGRGRTERGHRGVHQAHNTFLQVEGRAPLKQVYRDLWHNGGFVSTVLGYAAYTFVIGGLAFWMPSYITRSFDVSLKEANLAFGGLTVVGGFIGTLLGGWWADRWDKRSGNGYLKVAVVSMALTIPLLALVLSAERFEVFGAFLLLTEIALFLCISPIDAAIVGSVPPQSRATAMALNVSVIHLLGDGLSFPLIGWISDASDLRAALGVCPWILLVAGAMWSLSLLRFWQPVAWPQGALHVPRRQAHRGFWKSGVRENTLEAFRRASRAGAVMTELDVRLSGDGVPVVVHDADLKRICSNEARIEDLTAEELRSLAEVPSLRDVLRDQEGPRLLNIEIKSSGWGNGRLEEAVARVVCEEGAMDRVLFSSFNPVSLRRLARHLPGVPRGLLVAAGAGVNNPIWLRRFWLGGWARVHLLHIEEKLVTPTAMREFKWRQLPVAVWTVNDPGAVARVEDLGVCSVISDSHFVEPNGTASGGSGGDEDGSRVV